MNESEMKNLKIANKLRVDLVEMKRELFSISIDRKELERLIVLTKKLIVKHDNLAGWDK